MTFEWNIALRYLTSKKQFGFVRVIGIISIVGVAIGVGALVVVLSVFNGFNGLVSSILINFDPHVKVEKAQGTVAFDYAALSALLGTQKEVRGCSPFVQGKALILARNNMKVVTVKGIDAANIGKVSGLQERMVLGSLSLNDEHSAGMVLGMALADRLGVVVGDTLSVVSPAGSEAALLQQGQPLIRRFHVVGIFESNNKDYDGSYAFVGLAAAQALFHMGDKVHGVEIRLQNLNHAEALKSRLEQQFGSTVRVSTWYDLHAELYSVMQIERWMAFVILCLIISVASFNLLGSLTMTVLEKTRDIGILRSMGARKETIRRVYSFQGLMVGIIGSIIGLVLGLMLVYAQETFHLFPLDSTVYIIPAIPTEVHVADLVLVVATAVLFSSLAALYPAKRAAELVPVEAIRWE